MTILLVIGMIVVFYMIVAEVAKGPFTKGGILKVKGTYGLKRPWVRLFHLPVEGKLVREFEGLDVGVTPLNIILSRLSQLLHSKRFSIFLLRFPSILWFNFSLEILLSDWLLFFDKTIIALSGGHFEYFFTFSQNNYTCLGSN